MNDMNCVKLYELHKLYELREQRFLPRGTSSQIYKSYSLSNVKCSQLELVQVVPYPAHS